MMKKPRHELAGTLAGEGKCPSCGGPVRVTVMGNGFLGMKCAVERDGGCSIDIMSRADRSSAWLAKNVVTKWRHDGARAMFIAGPVQVAPVVQAVADGPAAPPPAKPKGDDYGKSEPAPVAEKPKRKTILGGLVTVGGDDD